MHEVLLVYKQIEMQFDENGDLIVPDNYKLTITVSYDEKPGIQAISNTAPDLRPTPEHGEVYRDAEYKRLGTLSLLAGIDLLTGEAIPLVSETHKSSDFIEFLKILDKKYPSQDTIRIILDNHSAHTSKERCPMMRNRGFRQSPILHQIYARHQNTERYIVMQNTNVLERSLCWQALTCLQEKPSR